MANSILWVEIALLIALLTNTSGWYSELFYLLVRLFLISFSQVWCVKHLCKTKLRSRVAHFLQQPPRCVLQDIQCDRSRHHRSECLMALFWCILALIFSTCCWKIISSSWRQPVNASGRGIRFPPWDIQMFSYLIVRRVEGGWIGQHHALTCPSLWIFSRWFIPWRFSEFLISN